MAFKKRLGDRYVKIKGDGELGGLEFDQERSTVEIIAKDKEEGQQTMDLEPAQIKREVVEAPPEIRDCVQSIVNAVAEGEAKKRKRSPDHEVPYRKRSGREFEVSDWETEDDDEDTNYCSGKCKGEIRWLRNEVKLLKSSVKRLVHRQELLEDFGTMESGNRFKTFANAREKLLELGKMQVGSYPELVLSPGSPHLINVLTKICDSNNSSDIKVVAEGVASEYLKMVKGNLLATSHVLISNNETRPEISQHLHPKSVIPEQPTSRPIADFIAKNSHLIPKTQAPTEQMLKNPFFTTSPSMPTAAGTGIGMQRPELYPNLRPPAPFTSHSSGSSNSHSYSYGRINQTHIHNGRNLLTGHNHQYSNQSGNQGRRPDTIQEKQLIIAEIKKLETQILSQKTQNPGTSNKPIAIMQHSSGQKTLLPTPPSVPKPLLPTPPFAASTPNFQFSHIQAFPGIASNSPSAYTNTSQVYFCTGQNGNNNFPPCMSNGPKNSGQQSFRPKKKAKRRKKQISNSNYTPIRNR